MATREAYIVALVLIGVCIVAPLSYGLAKLMGWTA